MYKITKGIHIHFGHVVQGHSGLCLGPHGHTWYFEVTLSSGSLDTEGFVCDFSNLKRRVLAPVETALDHAFALSAGLFADIKADLTHMGNTLLLTRAHIHGDAAPAMQAASEMKVADIHLPELNVIFCGSVKAAVFDFTPTSERLAEWLYRVAQASVTGSRVSVDNARVYETLQPVMSYAEYSGN